MASRATSTTTNSAWALSSFTTVAPPAEPEPQVWTCPLDGLTFDTEEALAAHYAEAHAPAPVRYTCPVDGLVFDTQQELADHYNQFHRSAELVEPTPVIPAYLLWMIIGIGAVLIISLIVLIIRTRRVA